MYQRVIAHLTRKGERQVIDGYLVRSAWERGDVEWVEPWRFTPGAPAKTDPDTLPEDVWTSANLWEADAVIDALVRRGVPAELLKTIKVMG